MRVFVTGATGFIGSAIVRELLTAGHDVLGLARSDAAADRLARLGVAVHRGTLAEPETLAAGARLCDGVIHTAFLRGPDDYATAGDTDRQAIAAFGAALAGSGGPLVVTSGTMALTPGRLGTEDDAADPNSPAGPRVPSEAATLAWASAGVRAALVRLPPSVHGDGDHGFIPALIAIARAKGVSAYVGDGGNRWPAVHRLDAARLFRLVLEHGEAGARYHAVGDEAVPMGEIAAVIGRRLDLPVVAKSPEEAADHFGRLGRFLGIDGPASSALTQTRLGWHPSQPGLIADLDHGSYFMPPQTEEDAASVAHWAGAAQPRG